VKRRSEVVQQDGGNGLWVSVSGGCCASLLYMFYRGQEPVGADGGNARQSVV
jgi:hypothetical protein